MIHIGSHLEVSCNAGTPGTQMTIMLNLLVWGIGIWCLLAPRVDV